MRNSVSLDVHTTYIRTWQAINSRAASISPLCNCCLCHANVTVSRQNTQSWLVHVHTKMAEKAGSLEYYPCRLTNTQTLTYVAWIPLPGLIPWVSFFHWRWNTHSHLSEGSEPSPLACWRMFLRHMCQSQITHRIGDSPCVIAVIEPNPVVCI